MHSLNPLSAEHFGANWLHCQYWWLYIGLGHDVPGYVNRALKGLRASDTEDITAYTSRKLRKMHCGVPMCSGMGATNVNFWALRS